MMDIQRLVALVVFMFSGMMLWEQWHKFNNPQPLKVEAKSGAPVASPAIVPPGGSAAVPAPAAREESRPLVQGQDRSERRVVVETDTLRVEFGAHGADIRKVTLLQHTARGDKARPFTLLQDKAGAYFIAQSGLIGEDLPNHTTVWDVEKDAYQLTGDQLEVRFSHKGAKGVSVDKVFTFRRGQYVVDVRHDVRNGGEGKVEPSAYYRFLRDANPPEGESSGNMFTGVVTFTGPAVYTDLKKFQKVEFSDVDKGKADYVKNAEDGWLAMVQHYFVSAWLPKTQEKREYRVSKEGEGRYSAAVVVGLPAVDAGKTGAHTMSLYLGPQEQEKLKALAPGLDLVVDYGMLTLLAKPMFLVLAWINGIVGNWGWTIIIFTILLKLVFFPLNQKAGKSMAHMKQLGPKVEALRARYGDDKLKMNQAMMELYKTEKVNPLGGCLPILIQMPFLIAMYWVLLGAVELRNAPWLGWITDLSTPDPLYILPVIMGVSMIVQTKLNPTPPDPVQAKVMMIMPVVFSVMFFFFPAGLVLYWTMQNILGIAQQWYINKVTENQAVTPATKKR